MKFVHLHCHSEYSIGDGLFSPSVWAQAFHDAGYAGAALTDHGTMGGSLEFYYAAKKLGIKAIMGCEFYFNANPLLKNSDNRKLQHIVLLAKDFAGWQSLLKLQKWSHVEGAYYRPRIGFDEMYAEQGKLICLTACVGGILGIGQADYVERYNTLRQIFGEDLYVEFQSHNFPEQVETNLKLAALPDIKPIVTSDCHFILKEHRIIQKMLKNNIYKSGNPDDYVGLETNRMESAIDIARGFQKFHKGLPKSLVMQGLKNTGVVFNQCNVDLEGKIYLPAFSKKVGSKEFFTTICKKALASFLKNEGVYRWGTRDEYLARFAKEMKVILKYNLADYFLIVWDILRFARSQGIYTGIGRGSSAGSFVCYLLKITQINPLQYGLIFERMLNEIRCELGELPDVDMDLESARRQEVKDYMIRRYGRDNVCEIGTYGRLKLKSSIIDFGKQFGISHAELLKITTKMDLEKDDEQSLDAAIESSSELRSYMVSNPDYAFVVENINGQIKSQSIHPAGVLISSDPIASVTPVKLQTSTKSKEKVVVTQSEDSIVLRQGLIKIDLLGLKEYDIFKYIIDNIDSSLTVDNYVSIIHEDAVELKSPEVWKMFQDGRTEAVFQFSSSGMRRLLCDIVPDCMDDLVAAVALYRPGCIENGWHIDYCQFKSGSRSVSYACPELQVILGSTYGIPIFQEQIMEICNKVGGIPLTESDIIRSALGKKDMDKLASYKTMFVEGASKILGFDAAESYWKQIVQSAKYSFNKSHSAAYALVAYMSQYFKVKYPCQYWAAVLDFDTRKNDREKLSENRRAAVAMGVKIASVDINLSAARFTIEESDTLDCLIYGGSIRWSFGGVKGVGPVCVAELESKQPYSDFNDFYSRINRVKVKFDAMLNLAYAGCFDRWMDRKEAINVLYEKYNGTRPKRSHKCLSDSLTNAFLIYKFYEVCGFFEYSLKDLFDAFPRSKGGRSFCFSERQVRDADERYPVLVGGMVTDVRRFKTKKGEAMGGFTLIDKDESIDVTMFPQVWMSYRLMVQEGNVVLVNGQKSCYNGRENLINAEEITVISSF